MADMHMINTELADLFEQQSKIRKELSKVDAAIGHLCKSLDRETIEESKSSVTPDDEEFGKWVTARRKREYNIERKQEMKENNKLLPGYTAVYALYDDDEIVYVGVTNNIERRIKQHKRGGDKVFNRYTIVEAHVDRFYAVRQEHKLIEQHNPKYNKSSYI